MKLRQISWNFWIKYFHLILTKINCITLKIRSKADFKNKSQNIWQQIILFSRTVMQMICAWHKIWTLSGRLSLMRNVQLMNIYIYIYIYAVNQWCEFKSRRGKKKILTALKSNSDTVWFNFQTYIYIQVYIFRVYHIRIIATTKLVYTTWNRQIPQ